MYCTFKYYKYTIVYTILRVHFKPSNVLSVKREKANENVKIDNNLIFLN